MPNVMAALLNIGGALCSTPQSLLTPTTRVPCSNAAKTRNRLKFTGVPQTRQRISAASGPKFTVLSEHVEEVLLFNSKFFFQSSILLYLQRYSPTSLCDGAQMAHFWRFFLPFSVHRICLFLLLFAHKRPSPFFLYMPHKKPLLN